MAVSLRDFVRAIFGLYLVTLVVVVWDFYQKGFTLRSFDVAKLIFFAIWTAIVVLLIWRLKE
ncbi:hypothetical protein E2P65_02835 [Candidatus Bathyarchaeota archaeon]|nr:hypothetical protein E2P65_02835 [Candidatus Bathyarchaeota archaeon]